MTSSRHLPLTTRRTFLAQAAVLGAASVYPQASGATPGEETLPPPPPGRIHESFDRGWRFARGEHPGAERPDFDDTAWRRLDVPHDWSIEGPYDEAEPSTNGGAGLPTGKGWYRKHFRLARGVSQLRARVTFDGVYMDSTVWLNGRLLGRWPYGYTTFHYDLTPHLRTDGGPNVMAVSVDNSRQPGSRWYSGSGIYRHVWLTLTDPVSVEPWGVWVTTPEIAAESAAVRVRTRVRNERGGSVRVAVATQIVDPAGAVVAEAEAPASLAGAEGRELDQTLRVPSPRRWSPDTPELYEVRTRVRQEGRTVDECRTSFGIRELAFDVNRGFLLNGRPTKFLGMCLHHDGGPVGAAVPEDVLERRFRLLKEMGCNAVRTSHNPMAPEFYSLCDRLGLMVMDEIFDEWIIRKPRLSFGYSAFFKEWWERDLVNFIRRDRNHASVVLWSAGNEIHEQSADFGSEVLAQLMEVFRREDPTRLVTAGLDRVYTADPVRPSAPAGFVALLDVAGYNYGDRWEMRRETLFATDRAAFPQRRFVGTEDDNLWGARGVYAFRAAGPGLPEIADYTSNALGLIDTSRLWRFALTHDYDCGHFMWTGFDYLGEARWPRRAATAGVFDLCGFRKDSFYFYQSLFLGTPVLHLLPHWTWPGREGRSTPVVAFTNCEVVELFLNERSLGAKVREFPRIGRRHPEPPRRPAATTADLHLAWDVPYEPGVLKAVGYTGGAVVATAQVATAGAAAALAAEVDRTALVAGRRGVAHVVVRVVDAAGVLVPDADSRVDFQVSGPGRLIGVENGDPLSYDPHHVSWRRAHHGLCLGMVQAGDSAGEIEIGLHAKGLRPVRLRVAVQERGRETTCVELLP